MRLRDPESDHDGVAGEPAHRPSMGLDAFLDVPEEACDAPTRDLRIASRDQRRRVDEVDEHHRCKLAFHPSSLRTNEECPSFRSAHGFQLSREPENIDLALTGRLDRDVELIERQSRGLPSAPQKQQGRPDRGALVVFAKRPTGRGAIG